MKLFEFGDVTVSTIIEREGPQRKTIELFPDAAAEEERARGYMKELEAFTYLPASERIFNTYQSFLIQWPGRNIIVDTCVGENKARPPHFDLYPKKPYLINFAKTGLKPEDIDTVINTHLHVDHCGWNTSLVDGRWVPTFPNAKYYFTRVEYEYWGQKTKEGWDLPCRIWTDSALPLVEAGVATLVEMDEKLDDDIWLSPSPGHTPGHVCVNVRRNGQHVIFSGDLMHHAIQCIEPAWSSCFCEDPRESAETRRKFLEEVADKDIIVVPEHFPFPTAGRVVRSGDSFRYRFIDHDSMPVTVQKNAP